MVPERYDAEADYWGNGKDTHHSTTYDQSLKDDEIYPDSTITTPKISPLAFGTTTLKYH